MRRPSSPLAVVVGRGLLFVSRASRFAQSPEGVAQPYAASWLNLLRIFST